MVGVVIPGRSSDPRRSKSSETFIALHAIGVFFCAPERDVKEKRGFCMLSFVILVVGFALLVLGADQFVQGAAAFARRLGVSPLLIGLTVVAFGTSAPELAVSVTAALRGSNGIAVGNVLGSNLFNLLVVVGLSAILCPLVLDRTLLRRDWPLSVFAALLLLGMVVVGGEISRIDGIILIAVFACVMFIQIRSATRTQTEKIDEAEISDEKIIFSPLRVGAQILGGLACIVIGGELSVIGATRIARMFGLSETLIGLTVVAIGTSLPELVTSLVAARRGQNDIAMGNVIGSNLFNILFILGISATISPILVESTAIIDCLILLAASVVFYLPSMRGKLGRLPGGIMVLSYVAYMLYLIQR